MVRILKVNDVELQKRALLVRSEMYRQTLKGEVEEFESSVLQLKRTFGPLGISSFLLKLGLPLAGMFLFRQPAAVEKPRTGLLPKLALGFRLFRHAWSVLHGLRSRQRSNSRARSFKQW